MNQLKEVLSQITTAKQDSQSLYSLLLAILIKHQSQILTQEIKNIDSSILLHFIRHKMKTQISLQFYQFLYKLIQFAYSPNFQLQIIIYQIIPSLLTKYILASDQKIPHLQNCIRVIYNNEYLNFNKNLISRQLLINKNGSIGLLYKEHFNSSIKTFNHIGNLSEIGKNQEINSLNRVSVKSVLLLTILNNIEKIAEKTLISYLWMVYIYCGGSQEQDQTGVTLYLLQKKNLFSIFKYYISFEEMSIILLTLFQLSMQRKKNKFEILSTINMIHKKAANQSMFKISEVAQSTVHLLEDQYAEAFS